jgi:hypothetical protein
MIRTTPTLLVASLLAVASLVACNANVAVDKGSSSTGAGGGSTTSTSTTTTGAGGGSTTSTSTSSTTSTTTVPDQCAVPTQQTGPYAVKFQFTVGGHSVLFLKEQCTLGYTVTACADGYLAPLTLSGACTADCSQPDVGCVECGACMDDALQVTSEAPGEATWDGQNYTFQPMSGGCECHVGTPVPAAKYRLSVPVYGTHDDAIAGTNAQTVTVDFTLPAPNGVVVVPLDTFK